MELWPEFNLVNNLKFGFRNSGIFSYDVYVIGSRVLDHTFEADSSILFITSIYSDQLDRVRSALKGIHAFFETVVEKLLGNIINE